MRCPNCEKWNRASLPRCMYCGADLPDDSPVAPSWRSQMMARSQGKAYIRVDEDGDIAVTPDDREVLAAEMTELKARKDDGEERQRQLREASGARRPAPRTVSNETSPFPGMESDPLEPEPEPAPRHRVRINGLPQEAPAPSAENPVTPPADANTQRPVPPVRDPRGTRTVYVAPNQWQDSRTYDPIVDDMRQNNVFKQPVALHDLPKTPSRRMGLRRAIRMVTILLVLGIIGLAGYLSIAAYQKFADANAEKNRAIVNASIVNDLAAHTVLIPGEEGQSIYIKELASASVVVGGFATFEIEDHTWYSDLDAITDETMTVTLTPYARTTSGRQKPLDVITYDIAIPLSPIELVTPESFRTEVTTAMFSMLFNVRPDSTVYINGENVSDAVSEAGTLTYNATVQPIGDNVYNISVRSPYCRDNSMQVVLYREVQEIPLDLAATTYTSTSLSELPITATTIPGAEIDILSPHSDLKITDLDITGAFTFNAIFDKIGYNTISIEASYPGKKTSRVDYVI